MAIFDPLIFDPEIFDAGPITPPVNQFHLYRNGTLTSAVEWDANWSEIVGSVGEASVTVQNRESDPDLDWHTTGAYTRDIVKLTYGPGDETDWVLFEGECVSADLDLPPGFPWRRWNLRCTDWNTVPDLRLINAPDGQNWGVRPGGDGDLAGSDPNGPFPIDPDALPLSTDQLTIQEWYDDYLRAPDGGSFETATFVGEYVGPGHAAELYDGLTGEPNYVPGRGTVKQAIAGLSALAATPVSDWIDPDRAVHHVSFDVPDVDLMPDAPVEITDVGSEWDGTTKIGGRALHITVDRGLGPEEAYIDGVTDFLALAADDPDIGVIGSRYPHQGTGWGHSDPDTSAHTQTKRQTIFSGQAVTATQRDALADAVVAWADRPRYRGRITAGGRDDEGNGLPIVTGFRTGQRLTITEARLPADLDGVAWPIQAIRGSLQAGRGGPGDPESPSILQYTFEFGDAPQGQFSAMLAQHERAKPPPTAKPAPKHVIYFQTLNPKPESTQTLTSQARGNDDLPVKVKGVPVHWEFVSVTDHLGTDVSGNGESLDPADTVTDENGQSTTTFTAGTESDTYYEIAAFTDYQA